MSKLLNVSGVDDVPLRESRAARRVLERNARAGGLLPVSGVEGRKASSVLAEAAAKDVGDFSDFMQQLGTPLTAEQRGKLKKNGLLKKRDEEDAGDDTALDGILEPDDDTDDDDTDDDDTCPKCGALSKSALGIDDDDDDDDAADDEDEFGNRVGGESRRRRQSESGRSGPRRCVISEFATIRAGR